MSSELEIMQHAAREAGAVLRNYFGTTFAVTPKSMASDMVTDADLASEKAIVSRLRAQFPEYGIQGEEGGSTVINTERRFVIDPLDGTNNFVLGIPHFSITIAYFEGTHVQAALVYHPILDRMYAAELGKGATLNDVPIHVNEERVMSNATVAYACAYAKIPTYPSFFKLFNRSIKRPLAAWSEALDLCLLASGKIEAMISDQTQVYDFAAGRLIAKEAGAHVTDLSGNPEANDENNRFLATNGAISHADILKLVNSISME